MSSILIKGMKKPTACYKCPLRTGKYCGILTENERCADDGVLPHCPIVEISEPHGRLIDADYMKRHLMFSQGINDCGALYAPYDEIKKEIDRMPTVIESEEQENE